MPGSTLLIYFISKMNQAQIPFFVAFRRHTASHIIWLVGLCGPIKLKNWLSLRCEMGRFPSILFAAPEFISQAYCCICILLFSWWTSISEMSFNICLVPSIIMQWCCAKSLPDTTHVWFNVSKYFLGLHHLFYSKNNKTFSLWKFC